MNKQKRIIFIGAHPDDCELCFGGTAVRLARAGHLVKYVSCCNGDKGHLTMPGPELAARRHAESLASCRIGGISEYENLGVPDCELMPTLELRQRIIRIIRQFTPDLVISHRLCDYHADHRAAGQLVQDAAYLVMVPHCCPDTPIPPQNPVFACCYDEFTDPRPFRIDAAIPIDESADTKLQMLDCHASQFYEWLAWELGVNDFYSSGLDKRQWLIDNWLETESHTIAKLAGLTSRYAEAFELSPYGRKISLQEFNALLNP